MQKIAKFPIPLSINTVTMMTEKHNQCGWEGENDFRMRAWHRHKCCCFFVFVFLFIVQPQLGQTGKRAQCRISLLIVQSELQ